ncbi:MAG TPA: hypothetical protein VFU59_06850, partial [Candidatus Eisenbacteria bacterium]|nr:hypothetical protein [Candidatus Eisenbacteria bacterium]
MARTPRPAVPRGHDIKKSPPAPALATAPLGSAAMLPYALSHLSDTVLLRNLVALVVQDRHTTASLLAHMAEVDSRRLYAPAGYPSMHAYCVEGLGLSEDAAYKRIQAARAARQFPAILDAIAQGRIHLTGACLLAPYLTQDNAPELLAASMGRRKSEIQELLARRFPPTHVGSVIRPLVSPGFAQLAPAQVGWVEAVVEEVMGAGVVTAGAEDVSPGASGAASSGNSDGATSDQLAPAQVEVGVCPTSTEGERFLVQLVVEAGTREKLRRAQALLSHSIPSGDVAHVIDRALDALIAALEKRKFGVGAKRVATSRSARSGARYIPVQVRRAAWERDEGRCTFVSAAGVRCRSRRFLEFDHVEPVARGGASSVESVRLRCRAHNQLEADRALGAEFMRTKRETARHEADFLAGL